MKRALVFSGGGSRGSYEIGVWQALEEAGLRFHMCFGTSIGAINAALFLQGDRALAARLWDEIAARGLLRGGGAEGAQVERMFGRKREILPFLLEHARQMRLDITPLETLLREHLREGRVRAAGMGFGLVAMKFPTLAMATRTLETIPEGRLVDWVLASSACFPIFPTREIDGERYVDGGYCDNLPIDMALRAGAEEVLAVELHPAPTHPEYVKMPFLTTVLPRRELGAFLDFDEALVRRNRARGYCDAMKQLGRFDGLFYTFSRVNDLRAATLGRRLMREIAAFDAEAVRRAMVGADRMVAPLMGALEAGLREEKLSFKQALLRALELAAALMGCPEDAVYEAGALAARLREALLNEDAPAPQSAGDAEALARMGERRALSGLARALCERGRLDAEWVAPLCSVPTATAAALGLACAAEL